MYNRTRQFLCVGPSSEQFDILTETIMIAVGKDTVR